MHHTGLLLNTINLHKPETQEPFWHSTYIIHCQVLLTVPPTIPWTNSLLPILMLQGYSLHPRLFQTLSISSSHFPYFQWFLLLLEWSLNSYYRHPRLTLPMSAAPIENPLPVTALPSGLLQHWPSYRCLNRIYMDVVCLFSLLFHSLPPPHSVLNFTYHVCWSKKSYLFALQEGKLLRPPLPIASCNIVNFFFKVIII